MQPEKWIKIKDLFGEAIKLEAIPRNNFLNGITDTELRGEVEKLISADAEAATINNVFTILPEDAEEYAGKRVGNYRIIKEIGAGGMGSVFLAEREDFEKQVALKIVKHEFSSKELRRRFQTERQILATLEHPNIAHLLDGGTTESGLPYFVLEYIEGEDLLSYCEKRNLSVKQRLEIFRKVCSAVAYAHSRLVVHRDLKPSNILITKSGEPKLLDFGISKLVNQTSFEETGTATALGMMTPNYASPEQFRGESVTTATDIYSLGVILYELLTDNLPYAVTNTSRLDEVARAVCEKEPTAPSRVNSERGTRNAEQKTNQTANKRHRTNPQSAIRNPQLKGDLDNIILKALRKEPTRRYSSVEKFSDDIRRHLEGLPVSARPDTFGYRAEKFFKRNRVAVIAAAIVLLTLIGGIVGTTWQAIRAEQQRKVAENRFAQVRQLANNVVFKYYDDIKNLPGSTKARQTLVNDAITYLDNLSQGESDDLSLQRDLARAYQRVGDVQGEPYQANIGDTAGAIESYRKALKIFSDILDKSSDLDDKRELVQAQQKLAILLVRVGSDNVAEVVNNSIAVNEQIVAENPESNRDKLSLARSYISLADISVLGFGENQSIPILQKALALVEPIVQSEPENTEALYRLAAINQRLGFHCRRLGESAAEVNKISESQNLLRKSAKYYAATLISAEKMQKLDPQNASYRRNYFLTELDEAIVLRELGENEKALEILLKVLKEGKSSFTSDLENVQAVADLGGVNIEVALVYLNMNDLQLADKYGKTAVSLLDIAVERDANNLEYYRGRFHTMMDYGKILTAKNEFDLAIENYQTAYDQLQKANIKQNTESLKFYESTSHEKIADTEISASEKSAEQKQNWLRMAHGEYQKALDILQSLQNNSGDSMLQVSTNNIAEKVSFIREKLTQTQAKLSTF